MVASIAKHDTTSAKIQFDTFYNVIDGKLVSGLTSRYGINPATKQPNLAVPVATLEDVDNAVTAANKAFKLWSKTTIEERREKLVAFAEALDEHADEFASLLTIEQGRPVMFAKAEVAGASTWLTGIGNLDLPEEILEDNEERKVVVRYTPLGVVAAIVPWNYPLQLACGKIAPALLTGNTIIVKPSPYTPYCGLKLIELAQKFFPPGVVQALSGDDSLGPWLTAHAGINKISFTGSTATGKRIMESASRTLKRVTLELGGNDPAIICKSVDIAATAPKIALFAFMNSGQICVAVKRVYIHEDIYDEFRDALIKHTQTFKVGGGFAEGVTVGPMQNSMQYERVQGFFDDIEKQGQKVAVGGKVPGSAGYFITPTIIDNPKDDSRLVVEEPFGPILPILSWSDEDEVIDRANNTHAGLGASVWSSDLAEAERIGKLLEAGSVWINAHMELGPAFPFGGHKESGIGVEWGVIGLKSFCNEQTLYFKKV